MGAAPRRGAHACERQRAGESRRERRPWDGRFVADESRPPLAVRPPRVVPTRPSRLRTCPCEPTTGCADGDLGERIGCLGEVNPAPGPFSSPQFQRPPKSVSSATTTPRAVRAFPAALIASRTRCTSTCGCWVTPAAARTGWTGSPTGPDKPSPLARPANYRARTTAWIWRAGSRRSCPGWPVGGGRRSRRPASEGRGRLPIGDRETGSDDLVSTGRADRRSPRRRAAPV